MTLEVLALLGKKADVGQHEIHPRQIRAREGNAAIDHDPLPVILRSVTVECEIHADLANAAERQEHQFVLISHTVL